MNTAAIDNLSAFGYSIHSLPKDEIYRGNTFSVSQYGDICMLTDNPSKPIVYCNLRSISSSEAEVLPLDISFDQFSSYEFDSIAFNETGNTLLLTSVVTNTIGMIVIPHILARDGKIDISSSDIETTCKFQLLAEDYLRTQQLVKASFHSLTPYCVVVLMKNGPLILIDIIRNVSHTINLHGSKSFVSFTCGPHSCDWLRYTIFLVTDDDEIYALCPVIPSGINLNDAACTDIWNWFEDQCQSGVNEEYLKDVESFISVVFPRSYGLSDEMDSYSRNTQTRDAMSANRLRNSKQSDLQNMYRNLLRPVAIQGPLRMENSNVSKSRDACKPSDISCIRSKSIDSANAPVIVISYDNGMVKFCLLNCSDEAPFSFVSPLWNDLEPSQLLVEVSSLVIADQVNLSTMDSKGHDSVIRLTADPVHGHNFFASTGSGKTYLIISKWLRNVISNVSPPNGDRSKADVVNLTEDYTDEDSSIGHNIVYDPLLGHVFLHRSIRRSRLDNDLYALGALNLSAHLQLMEMDESSKGLLNKSLSDEGVAESKSPSNFEEFRLRVHNDSVTKSILNLRDAVDKIPKPAKDVAANLTETQCVRDLSAANLYISDNVMLPFEEMGQRLLFRMETIQTTLNLLYGYGESSSESKTSGKVSSIKEKLNKLSKEYDILRDRLETIQQKHERQKVLADTLYQIAVKTKLKLSQPEKAFKEELLDWKSQLIMINNSVEKMKRNAMVDNLVESHHPKTPSSTKQMNELDSVSDRMADDKSIFSPFKSPSRGLFMVQPNKIVTSTAAASPIDISSIDRSPSSVHNIIGRSPSSFYSPISKQESTLSIGNLQPSIRTPYKPSLLHKK